MHTGDRWRLGHRPALDGLAIAKAPAKINRSVWALQTSVVVLGALVYVSRGEHRLFQPSLHCEDGTVFLAGQWNDGISALWHTYAGYLNLGPRLIALAASQLPLTAIPLTYAIASVGIYLLVAGQVVSVRLSWLIPNRGVRATAFVIFCLLAPLDETYGNIANLIAVSGLALFLASMSEDPRSDLGRGTELIGCTIAALTGPFSIFLAPLFWYRWLREQKSLHSLRVARIVTGLAVVQAVCVTLSPRPIAGRDFVSTLSRALVQRLAGGWLFNAQPVFTTGHLIPIVAAGAWLAAVFWALLKLQGSGLVLVASVVLLIAVAAYVYGAQFVDSPEGDRRQLVVPMAMLVVGLCAVIARAPSPLGVAVAALALAMGASSVRSSLIVYPYERGSDMGGLQRCVESGRTSCSIPIFGPGWTLTLRAKG